MRRTHAEDPQDAFLLQRTVGGLRIVEELLPHGARLGAHAHPTPRLTYVVEGAFTQDFGKTRHALSTGHLVMKPAGHLHADECDRGAARCLLIDIAAPLPDNKRTPSLVFAPARVLEPQAVLGAIECIRTELLADRPGADDAIRILFEEILSRVSVPAPTTASHPPRRWMAELLEQLRASFREPLNLSERARQFALHPGHVSRAFQERFGMTPGAYVRELRIREGCRLLRHTECSVAEAAAASGFADQSHFGRWFRQRLRITPSELREVSRRRLEGQRHAENGDVGSVLAG